MADIKPFLNKIKSAVFGKDVRGSLHDGLEAVNKETEEATDLTKETEHRQKAVESQFDDVLSGWSDDKPIDNEETIASRTNRETGKNYETLGNRLDYENKEVTKKIENAAKQLEGLEVNVTTIGVHPNTDEDYTDILRKFISTGVIPVFPAGRYKVTDELLFKHGQGLKTVGSVIFDGSDFKGKNGDAVMRVTNDADDYISLPSPIQKISKGQLEIEFNDAHNLKVGDIICLYDNTDFSWSSARYYYRKGEFAKISSVVTDKKVILDSPVFDDYTLNSNFGVYKMNMGTFSIDGRLEITQNKVGPTYGLHIERVKDFTCENIVSSAKGAYASICFEQCFNIDFKGSALQQGLSHYDYGLAIVNSQHVRADGYFTGSRHAVSHTGKDKIGAIVVRDSVIRGTAKSDSLGATGVMAFDTHGCCENIKFIGTIYGGASISGASNKIEGKVYGGKDGMCVYFSDVKSFDHDLSKCKFITDKNPDEINRGIIDFGGTSTPEIDKMLGGTLNLSDIDVQAPNARLGVVVRTVNTDILRNSILDVNLKGSKVKLAKGIESVAYWIEKKESNAKSFRDVDITSAIYDSDKINVSDAENINLPKQKGRGQYIVDTSKNLVETTITFKKPFPGGYIPNINAHLNRGEIAGKNVIGKVSTINPNGFTFQVFTQDGSNFKTDSTYNFYWSAE